MTIGQQVPKHTMDSFKQQPPKHKNPTSHRMNQNQGHKPCGAHWEAMFLWLLHQGVHKKLKKCQA